MLGQQIQNSEKKPSPSGRCCQTGCPDCPYGYTKEKKIDPSYPAELQVLEEEELHEEFFTDYDEED